MSIAILQLVPDLDEVSEPDAIEVDHRRYDPWEHLKACFPHLTVELVDSIDGSDKLGQIYFDDDRIELRADLTSDETRATLTHELIHAERGGALEVHRDLEEDVVDLVMAARLIPVHRMPTLIEDLRAAGRASVLAADVGVDLYTIYAGLALAVAVKVMGGYREDEVSPALDVIANVARDLAPTARRGRLGVIR